LKIQPLQEKYGKGPVTRKNIWKNERELMMKRDRLISYSNMFSKNLFEKDEEINNATNLKWNRNYEEAINAACKIWTVIIQIDKSQT
jgi:hypothetical protein